MKEKYLVKGITAIALTIPLVTIAQEVTESGDEEVVEEIVVTGSYMKRNKEDFSSPVEVITAVEIQAAGNANLGQYVRDLTFTANTDTVANVFDFSDGAQDSNSARFNLRGLGTNSTLTLYNGERVLGSGQSNVGGIVPDIALQRVDVVMDGGSSLYGSDAVAGVVNLISAQNYEGIKIRGFYNGGDGFDQPKFEILAGHNFDNGLQVVGAISYDKKSTLAITERYEYARTAFDEDNNANPGRWNRGVDPSCGTFFDNPGDPNTPPTNDPTLTYDSNFRATFTTGPFVLQRCITSNAEFGDVNRRAENLVGYLNLHYDVNENLSLNMETNINRRLSDFRRSPSYSIPRVITVYNDHPAYPTPGVDGWSAFGTSATSVSGGWTPFSSIGTLPSFLEGGAQFESYYYNTDRINLRADYNFGASSWSGSTTISHQEGSREIDQYTLRNSRMTAAINGLGGANCAFDESALIGLDLTAAQVAGIVRPGGAIHPLAGTAGCEYFNPFGSVDSRSPYYQAGVTDNSQELVDWLYQHQRFDDERDELNYIKTFVTGEVFELPAGPVGVVVGYEHRTSEKQDLQSAISLAGDRLDSAAVVDTLVYEQTVDAAFAEIAIPITSRWSIDASARNEKYDEIDLTVTAPKIGTRFEVTEDITLRASWAKSFVAPDVEDLRFAENESCVAITGTDNLPNAAATRGLSCSSGNPMLMEQESTVKNIGLSWSPTDSFSINLDYQQLGYEGRISSLSSSTALFQVEEAAFNSAVASGALQDTHAAGTPDLIDPNNSVANPGPDGSIDAIDWANFSGNYFWVDRDIADGAVTQVVRHPINADSQYVNSWDLRIRNGFDLDGFGYFGQALSVTAYDEYEYVNASDETVDAVGQRNGDSSLAPPIPRYKANLNLNWFYNQQSASISFSYLDGIQFDNSGSEISTLTNGTYTPTLPANVLIPDQPPEELPSYTTINLRYGYNMDDFFGGNLDLALGVKNVTDKMPVALPIRAGFETRLYDNFGRQVYVDMTYEF